MKKYIIILIAAIALNNIGYAQIKAGDNHFNRLAFKQASINYERALKKDSTNVQVWSKLGDCYRLNRDSKNAERAYSHVVTSASCPPQNVLYYAEALMQNEKYAQAQAQLEKFKTLSPTDSRGKNLEQGIKNLSDILAKSGSYSIKVTNLNSMESDFSPVAYNGGLVFTSNRKNIAWVDYSHSWTGKQFFRLYHAKGSESSFSAPTLFAGSLKTKYNDGPICFNATGSQMLFTRNNIVDGKIIKDASEVVRMKIFTTNWSSNEWGVEIPFVHNSDNYSCAHPALSADGKTMYFASDMPGGRGGMDLWKCEWTGNDWGPPSNLSMDINTAGNEVFPCLGSDGMLYFASDGLAGIGGLDLFTCEITGNKLSAPENMGAPINSSADDFGITYNPASKSGYFTSNRKADGLNDDIYYFVKLCTNTDVVIVDDVTGEPIRDAQVTILENGVEIGKMMTDETGKFNKCLNPSRNYDFKAKKDAYTDNMSSLTSAYMAAAAATGTQVIVPLNKKPVITNRADLKGRLFNADDKTGVSAYQVKLINKSSGAELITMTDDNGAYKFENIALDSDYDVIATKKDCGEAKESFNTRNITGPKTITKDLPFLCKGDIIRIENIYYDYNKSNIRPDAAIELDKVIVLLNKYPTMSIELRSHTDARGKDDYNAKLSDSRAKSAVDYIIGKGISKSRLTAKGYGETQLLNKCKNGVECDDKTHEENRRTEFKILSM